ncbi:MAG: FKBP-type peptidyl-prolyl cis-trans isomerase [Lentimicrobium sp.]|nr:FKBP-type peptidyl-prolyl cis-trans isomerase [Lentimicrobium sp.]
MFLLLTSLNSEAIAQKSKKDKKSKEATEAPAIELLKTRQDSISYMIGRDIGRNMKTNEIDVTAELLYKGLKDGLNGVDAVLDEKVTEALMMSFQMEMMAKQQKAAETSNAIARQAGEAFLAENRTKSGVIETPSGLQYRVITEGSGDHPSAEDVVEVHYTGRLIDGTVFDSSVERGESIKFPLNGVIPGWTEGVQLMCPGSKYEFVIPSELAYGERGTGPIPGGSVLIFEVELISIEKQ